MGKEKMRFRFQATSGKAERKRPGMSPGRSRCIATGLGARVARQRSSAAGLSGGEPTHRSWDDGPLRHRRSIAPSDEFGRLLLVSRPAAVLGRTSKTPPNHYPTPTAPPRSVRMDFPGRTAILYVRWIRVPAVRPTGFRLRAAWPEANCPLDRAAPSGAVRPAGHLPTRDAE